ncbi:MAG: preprotein translocase subunit SecE [Bacilli bacterium]
MKFFKDVISELKKVKWPDKKYMIKYSIATFATIIMCSLYFYLITVVFAIVKELR